MILQTAEIKLKEIEDEQHSESSATDEPHYSDQYKIMEPEEEAPQKY